jgi:hypothetical protein
MVEDRKSTAKEELKWRAEFKALGREAVRARSPAFQPHIKRDLAVRWLREQELAAERRERGRSGLLSPSSFSLSSALR